MKKYTYTGPYQNAALRVKEESGEEVKLIRLNCVPETDIEMPDDHSVTKSWLAAGWLEEKTGVDDIKEANDIIKEKMKEA